MSMYVDALRSVVGYATASIGITTSQICSVGAQFYADVGLTSPVGAAGSLTTIANTAGELPMTTATPAGYLQITVSTTANTNSSVSNPSITIKQ